MFKSDLITGVTHLIENDSRLAVVIKKAGACRLKPHKNYYLSFVEAIVGQQLSMKAADKIFGRFMDYFDNDPQPEKIIAAPDQTMRDFGLSWAKVAYVKDIAAKILSDEVHFRGLAARTDEDIISEFIKIKGVGVWTVQMFLIFTLGRLNVLPVGDLGIKKGIMKVYNLKKLPDEKKIIALARKNKWSPYNSIASWYIWRSLDMEL